MRFPLKDVLPKGNISKTDNPRFAQAKVFEGLNLASWDKDGLVFEASTISELQKSGMLGMGLSGILGLHSCLRARASLSITC